MYRTKNASGIEVSSEPVRQVSACYITVKVWKDS